MKRLILILLLMALLVIPSIGQEEAEIVEQEQEEEIITNLNVTLFDDLTDSKVLIENAIVQIKGKLSLIDNTFDYTKTLLDGDKYEVTILIKPKGRD